MISIQLAKEYPSLVKGLILLNAPHPDILIRLLQSNREQQIESEYMLDLMDLNNAVANYSADNYERLQEIFEPYPWWTETLKNAYLNAWNQPNAFRSMAEYFGTNILTNHVNNTYFFGPDTTSTFLKDIVVENIPTLVLSS